MGASTLNKNLKTLQAYEYPNNEWGEPTTSYR
jgi:hypothetical protein